MVLGSILGRSLIQILEQGEGEKSPSRTLSSVLLWSILLQLLMSPVSCSGDQVILTLEG